MSSPDSSRFPVTVTRLPLIRCEICGRTLAYQPGQASAVLTKHYHRMHPEALSEAAEANGPQGTSLADEATILLTVTAGLPPVRFLTPIRRRAAKSGTLEAWQKR